MASASGRRDAIDLERGKTLSELLTELPPGPPKFPRSPARDPLARAGQVCFVCLDRPRHGQYAIAVPCLKPSKERQIQHLALIAYSDDETYGNRDDEFIVSPGDGSPGNAEDDSDAGVGETATENSGEGSSDNNSEEFKAEFETASDDNTREGRPPPRLEPIYNPMEEWEKAVEDDRAVYARMVETCFRDLGSWRRWLPFYGVVSVNEVTIKFDGRVGPNDRFFGLIEPVDLEKTKEECYQAIKNYPVIGDWNGWNDCNDGGHHTEECEMAMEHAGSECLKVAAEKAEERLTQMQLRYLLKQCARDPDSANGLKTLRGMAQESCIYSAIRTTHSGRHDGRLELPGGNDAWIGIPVRAFGFVFGWQMDRITVELPFSISVGLLGVGIVWLAVLLSKGGGADWNIAFAFAQVVAASIAILLTSLRY
ncbi:hypothetical protein B0T18DRAFT_395806 [Schizothecium vesticola]|uniref:Uncharacterized protein n=1 Tax=Schizothecium vesticola TaxID=314040 RepID=A0AA40F871_9PEZI|nr:hypothetical protein B0T18DRAFT_395806 [Schizothecium vesticola]